MPTASRRSRRPATCSIRRSPGACRTMSTPRGTGSIPPKSYRAFRGRDPDVSALLRKRGFLQEVAEAGGEER